MSRSAGRITAASCLLMCLGSVSIDLYLPSLPAIADRLGVSDTQAQVTIACYLLVYALVQPIVGPLAERIGRRSMMLCGLLFLALGSLGAATSHSIHALYLWRMLQGVGGGFGSTLSRVLLRDVYTGPAFAKRMSFLAIAWGGSPLIAPVIGGYLQSFFGWRSSFFLLFLATIGAALYILFWVHETATTRHPVTAKVLVARYRHILSHREFLGFTCAFFCAEGVLISYATASPILLQEELGLTPVAYGWSMLAVAIGFIIGSVCNSYLVTRFSIPTIFRWAIRAAFVGALWFLATGFIGWESVTLFVATMFGIEMAIGYIFPNAMAGAVHPFAEHPATASALFGCIATFGGASFSWIVAHLPEVSQIPLAALMVGQLLVAYLLLARVALPVKAID